MTVRELIIQLNRFRPNALVVMSEDPEGNKIRELCEAAQEYVVDEGYGLYAVHPDDLDEFPDAFSAVCLWPN